jgi:hypothetical protein
VILGDHHTAGIDQQGAERPLSGLARCRGQADRSTEESIVTLVFIFVS